MFRVKRAEFEQLVNRAIEHIPAAYQRRLQNVAFIVEEEASPGQRHQLGLGPHDLLFGLYEGVPLPERGGTTKLLPDKVTVYQRPLEQVSHSRADLAERVGRTVWHEVAHYYGLNHQRIHFLEQKG